MSPRVKVTPDSIARTQVDLETSYLRYRLSILTSRTSEEMSSQKQLEKTSTQEGETHASDNYEELGFLKITISTIIS